MKTYCVLRHRVYLNGELISDTDDEEYALNLRRELENGQVVAPDDAAPSQPEPSDPES